MLMSSSASEVPVRADGAKPLSPVATTAKRMSPATVHVSAGVVGFPPVVDAPSASSRTDVYPAWASPVAAIAHIVRPPVFGMRSRASSPSAVGSSRYHNSARHSVTPRVASACVIGTPS